MYVYAGDAVYKDFSSTIIISDSFWFTKYQISNKNIKKFRPCFFARNIIYLKRKEIEKIVHKIWSKFV